MCNVQYCIILASSIYICNNKHTTQHSFQFIKRLYSNRKIKIKRFVRVHNKIVNMRHEIRQVYILSKRDENEKNGLMDPSEIDQSIQTPFAFTLLTLLATFNFP
jgi:hypothetical protein